MVRKPSQPGTTLAKVGMWETVTPMISALHSEYRELTKRKADPVASLHKVDVVNRVLRRCLDVLEGERSVEFLEILDTDSLPQASDIAIVLAQYQAALSRFKADYYVSVAGKYQWNAK